MKHCNYKTYTDTQTYMNVIYLYVADIKKSCRLTTKTNKTEGFLRIKIFKTAVNCLANLLVVIRVILNIVFSAAISMNKNMIFFKLYFSS